MLYFSDLWMLKSSRIAKGQYKDSSGVYVYQKGQTHWYIFYGVVMMMSHFYMYKGTPTSGLSECFIMLQRIWNPAVLPFLFARLHFRKSDKKLFSSPLHLPRDTAECWRSHLLRSNLSFVSSYPHPPPPPHPGNWGNSVAVWWSERRRVFARPNWRNQWKRSAIL